MPGSGRPVTIQEGIIACYRIDGPEHYNVPMVNLEQEAAYTFTNLSDNTRVRSTGADMMAADHRMSLGSKQAGIWHWELQ